LPRYLQVRTVHFGDPLLTVRISNQTRAWFDGSRHRRPGHGLWLVGQVTDDISVVTGPAGSTVTVVFAPVLSDVPGGFAGPEPAR
jgi:hypothetical protein